MANEAVSALERIALLLEARAEPSYRVRAFRRALDSVLAVSSEELRLRAEAGTLKELAGVGDVIERVIKEALTGEGPSYLQKLEEEAQAGRDPAIETLLSALRGDCHVHSDWSDGGATIETMAQAAIALGREYIVLTDHSPRLTVANGLSPERLREQLDVVERLNARLAPFRILTGIECDILEDGTLDQEEELLARLDVVVGSAHSKLRQDAEGMTARFVRALANPHLDILGHCTGRIVVGRGRPQSTFDAQLVFDAAAAYDKAIEINSRPERLDPPQDLLQIAVDAGCRFAIDTDAHAPGQLTWLHLGAEKAALVGLAPERIVNTYEADALIEWAKTHDDDA